MQLRLKCGLALGAITYSDRQRKIAPTGKALQ